MAKLPSTIALNDIDMTDEYSLVPAGDYDVTVKEASLESNRAGNGQLIKLRLTITGPARAGACLFHRINIVNPNEDAQRIGRRELGLIMTAAGLSRCEDTDELVGASFGVRVKVDPPHTDPKTGKTYPESNSIGKIIVDTNAIHAAPTQSAPKGEVAKPSRRPW